MLSDHRTYYKGNEGELEEVISNRGTIRVKYEDILDMLKLKNHNITHAEFLEIATSVMGIVISYQKEVFIKGKKYTKTALTHFVQSIDIYTPSDKPRLSETFVDIVVDPQLYDDLFFVSNYIKMNSGMIRIGSKYTMFLYWQLRWMFPGKLLKKYNKYKESVRYSIDQLNLELNVENEYLSYFKNPFVSGFKDLVSKGYINTDDFRFCLDRNDRSITIFIIPGILKNHKETPKFKELIEASRKNFMVKPGEIEEALARSISKDDFKGLTMGDYKAMVEELKEVEEATV